ncbi:hypothetical protein LEP1GSC034_2264 [Leptospira interrogans str. 2003000735]|uniref:Uncharacterized protein n=3 Tax=Leptospira interrogans TaxID=173 RepID=M6K2F7_LEPIR|nr:hypothetical protein G436_1873 [Leptospira interrogans serovar Hardjo str. Norma]EJP01482.1 hypothetical protein LEP1GSC007_1652 [Leptospira interrogans serovar Bulgarica str. Mallika]EJP14494.1 hypothetical protein LEP1GSC080_2005 [Leptospira interrogans str. FPW2026]EKO95889.1 hypothetical protein LEP1GSC057_1329 [Leptospira interrogans str. Brem 329]EKP75688.1 hypothetical protein LEP1GSC173_1330 [Leptospira interrogans str. HAI1594]EKR17142.1 hypothetical protein LEP1GSC019_3626 [Leptos
MRTNLDKIDFRKTNIFYKLSFFLGSVNSIEKLLSKAVLKLGQLLPV